MASLTDDLVARLRTRIEDGELTPGQALPSEHDLVAELSVSRTVVREAVSRLRAAGLVETQRGRGSFVLARPGDAVFSVDGGDLHSVQSRAALLELRAGVEPEAAALAATRCSAADLTALRRASTTFREAVDTPAATLAADFALHLAVARACGNPHFPRLLAALGPQMIAMPQHRLRTGGPHALAEHTGRVAAEHDAVVEAVARGDALAAHAAMRTHLANSLARLVAGSGSSRHPRR